MVDTALRTLYQDEWIAAFERNQSTLRGTVTTAADIRAETAVFLTSLSSREAVTRGVNGLIPAATGAQTQHECDLAEWHDLPQKTNFDVLRAQADQRAIMISESQGVINRKIDDLIIDQLETGTLDTGTTATTMTQQLFLKAVTTLWNGNVPNDGNITFLLTPAAWSYLAMVPEFANTQFQSGKPNETGPVMKIWQGVKCMLHNGLPGVGTNAAKCFVYHKNAVGHAYAPSSVRAMLGYNEEQDYHWVRSSIYMGAKLLQNAGVVYVNHDDSALIGS